MAMLLEEWKKSLIVFSPMNRRHFFSVFFKNFIGATLKFLKYFGWLFFVDAALFIIYKGQYPKIVAGSKQINTNTLLLSLGLSMVWFLISTGFLLSIRKGLQAVSINYYKAGFLRYLQLSLIFSLILILFLNLLVGLGITVFPSISWLLVMVFRLFELLVVFYWLDSIFRLRDILFSLEKAINLILYNLPFLLIVFLFWSCLNYGTSFVFSWLGKNLDLSFGLKGLAVDKLQNVASNSFSTFFAIKVLAVKYLLFYLDYAVVGFIFTFYSLKKKKIYSYSLFERRDLNT